MAKDHSEAIEKAKRFANNAYVAEFERVARESQGKVIEARGKLAVRGLPTSSVAINEIARVRADEIRALAEARLNSTMEGYELFGVEIDDEKATALCFDVMAELDRMYKQAQQEGSGIPLARSETQYLSQLVRHVGISAAWVRTQIDRRRLMSKKIQGSTTIYSVQGDNARLNLNGSDNSTNIVLKSGSELFVKLQETIKAKVEDGLEQEKVIAALVALEQSEGRPSFLERYTDFIAIAANHMTILAPFIPALTQMLSHVR